MKTLFATTALAMLTTLPAFAAVIESDSTIDAATVFPEGATITRKAEFSADAGKHQIIIDDLPMYFDATSLRVTGEGTAAFRIVSVDHRIRRLPPRKEFDTDAYKALEAEREALEDRREDLMFDIQAVDLKIAVAEGRLKMVENLMEREPQRLVNVAAYTPRDATDWGQTIGVLAEQMDIALTAKLLAEREKQDLFDNIADLDEDIDKLEQRMLATRLPAQEKSVATIEIVADTAIEGTLNLEYRTDAAGWQPIYDLRLTQGEEATLNIERHARIHQHTGEAWDDVTLTLSTARPSLRMDAPMFASQIARLWNPKVEERMRDSIAGEADVNVQGVMPLRTAQAPMRSLTEATPEPVRFETRGRTLIFKITEPADIDGDGTTRQLLIDASRTTVDVSARATPRLDPSAYLYATLDNTFNGPILPGAASTYVDGAFIGQSYLPFTAQDAELTLPFGALDGVTISSEIKDRETGDYGILSTTNTQVEAFEFVATSVLPYDVPLTIYDRAPVSEDEDLVVDITAAPRPTTENAEGVRGLAAWTFDMKANSETVITFGYELSWPGEQELQLTSTDWPILHEGSTGSFVFR
ncbi:conserved hypothetical protein [Cognatiyoonia koreensis]|uniref:DUF4139 domain-containing protein n=1 Tax=Cognatiyoonia koreensis TaxID=364200 RepID=A0A1I0PQU1_9RHOB|nr:mucoidy inhibitor MuiA family protein [Cognatiyoonia koreensis]SEW16712.1 conserved hypothetical protein [Cognatiyoonia koreensis]